MSTTKKPFKEPSQQNKKSILDESQEVSYIPTSTYDTKAIQNRRPQTRCGVPQKTHSGGAIGLAFCICRRKKYNWRHSLSLQSTDRNVFDKTCMVWTHSYGSYVRNVKLYTCQIVYIFKVRFSRYSFLVYIDFEFRCLVLSCLVLSSLVCCLILPLSSGVCCVMCCAVLCCMVLSCLIMCCLVLLVLSPSPSPSPSPSHNPNP